MEWDISNPGLMNLSSAGNKLIQFNIHIVNITVAIAGSVRDTSDAKTSAPVILTTNKGKALSYMRKDFNYPCHVNVEEWHKM